MATKLAFQLFSLREFEGGWNDAFDAVKSLGVDTIEPWSGAVPSDPGAGTSIESMRAALDRAGFRLICGHISIDEFDKRYEQWKRLLLDYGSNTWVVPFAKAESLDEWMAWLPKFRAMATTLKADGLSLGYHNHHRELVKYGEKYAMEHLLDGMPELKAQFHIGQFLPSRGVRLSDWIRKYKGRICAIHVNDSNEQGPTAVGKGECRAEEAIKAALDTGVETFIMEVDLRKSTVDAVRRDVDFTRKLIG